MMDEPYKHQGGLAFPLTIQEDVSGASHYGMSLRDWFAGQALAGLTNVGNVELYDSAYEKIAVEAYRFADAMIKARGQ